MLQAPCRLLGAHSALRGFQHLHVLQAWLDPGARMAFAGTGLFLLLDSVVLWVASFSGSFTEILILQAPGLDLYRSPYPNQPP